MINIKYHQLNQQDKNSLQWLKDYGWTGFLHDQLNNKIILPGKDIGFASPTLFREHLELIKKWPKIRDVEYL